MSRGPDPDPAVSRARRRGPRPLRCLLALGRNSLYRRVLRWCFIYPFIYLFWGGGARFFCVSTRAMKRSKPPPSPPPGSNSPRVPAAPHGCVWGPLGLSCRPLGPAGAGPVCAQLTAGLAGAFCPGTCPCCLPALPLGSAPSWLRAGASGWRCSF